MSTSDAEQTLRFAIRALRLPEPVREHRFAESIGRHWRFDLCWPGLMLACEVEGGTYIQGRHTRAEGYEKDIEKYNTAALLGWTVLRVTPHMIEDGRAADLLITVLAQRGVLSRGMSN